MKTSTNEGEKIKHFLHTKGKNTLREKLKIYVSALKEGRFFFFLDTNNFILMFHDFPYFFFYFAEFSKGMILPKKDNNNKNVVNSKTTINVKAQMNTTVVSSKNKSANYQIDTIIIKQQQKFQCRAVEFFNMFTTIEVNYIL